MTNIRREQRPLISNKDIGLKKSMRRGEDSPLPTFTLGRGGEEEEEAPRARWFLDKSEDRAIRFGRKGVVGFVSLRTPPRRCSA
ncbi:hypothetical protein BHM03_00032266 [Ensete ventricosum]|uniref:Uncharacterized protein n=1 Tax=Ensete ventricosum TaxID=4639 RepID=A0A426YQZ9_ENSVE|nr:hypothetical protein B296_00037587 [Ensete ventricosum]RZS02257.1 hypothetical protein BHM03_00032266 [Ensete ventricosum]